MKTMISRIKGEVIENNLTNVVIDVNGVGYRVNCTIEDSKELKVDNNVSLHTHLDVKENSMELYGFLEEETMKLFQLLLTVNGVGPKTALNILNSTSSNTLIEGIASGDPKYLQEISGLSKKQSEKLVLTLKDKVVGEELDSKAVEGTSDAIEALLSLGYSKKDARDVVAKVASRRGSTQAKKLSTEEIIREALKNLNGKNT
jgi:Holliday junction DNA helicase RuvA